MVFLIKGNFLKRNKLFLPAISSRWCHKERLYILEEKDIDNKLVWKDILRRRPVEREEKIKS